MSTALNGKDKVIRMKGRSLGMTTEEQKPAPVNVLADKPEFTPPPPKTQKQIEHEKKEQEKYWNTMVTRREAANMAQNIANQLLEPITKDVGELENYVRMLYIQMRALTEILLSKGICTSEEIDAMSKPIIEGIYKTVEQSTVTKEHNCEACTGDCNCKKAEVEQPCDSCADEYSEHTTREPQESDY